MGFNGKTPPKPPGERATNKISKTHQHTWYDKKGNKKQTSCTCDTGVNHVTPKSN